MSSSEDESNHYSKKEIREKERRQQKNKKKNESKKANKKNREETIITLGEEKVELPEAVNEVDSGFEAEGGTNETEEEKDVTEMVKESKETETKEKKAQKGEEGKKQKGTAGDDLSVEIEYVGEGPELDQKDPNFSYFSRIFDAFKIKTEEELKREEQFRQVRTEIPEDTLSKAAISEQILQEELNQRRKEAEEAGEAHKMSRKKLRLALQPSMADLKASTPRADVVEWADVTSRDPFLLVELKSYRNTVMVPRHWNAKRKYLAGKRGFERPPFELPEFIKRTGIMEMRETMWEKEEHQSLKNKMRERTRPKLGRIDIDYQKLHDAFFKWQTKPQMTKMGELYYEGKELEAQMREKKPGTLSDELRIALGMPVGPNSNKFPPPWLIAMQRYGPPPSYPNLKIQGLNCPIPEGCAFGYHAGGWGKPPVDEYGKPLYGDVFGLTVPQVADDVDESRIERRHWGEIGSDEEESEEESEAEEDDEEGTGAVPPPPPEGGYVTPAPTEGFVTPSGITTVPGVETPSSTIELRKKRTMDESSLSGPETPAPPLYTILAEKKVDRVGTQLMATSHVYDIAAQRKIPVPNEGVEVSLNPEELEDQGGLERKYEEQLRKQAKIRMENEEDFSDMVAEHSAKQNRKRKVQEQKKTSSSSKKYKEFKF
ncbi:hypothetical protein niasHS_010854 [Heterodera schachtii]|uniref:PSP proline-rich domain-containing protein n=1 Tax=Heterodera schachtii TaxID=97005 RepID=A0ABD2IVA8_HETSC